MIVSPPSSASLLARLDLINVAVYGVLLWIVSRLATSFYQAYAGPLSTFPGPRLRALSIAPWIQSSWKGTEPHDIVKLHEEYGRAVRIAPNMISFIGNAQTWKDIYGFRKQGQQELVKDSLFYEDVINRAPALILTDQSTHSRQRKVVSHAFSDKALKEQEPMFQRWAKKLQARLIQDAEKGDKVDLVSRYNFTTFDIMADLTFAEPLHMLDNSEYVPWVKSIFSAIRYGTRIRNLRYLGSFPRWVLQDVVIRIPAVKRQIEKHWNYTQERLDRRLAKTPDRPDLWTRILERSEEAGENGLCLGEQHAIASLFMLAGTETTATALSGTTFHLLKNLQSLRRLQTEVRSHFSCVDDLALESLARLPFLNACLKEGIRMYPPVPIGLPRVTPPGGAAIDGMFVPEGTTVLVPHLPTYRDEGSWTSPYDFRPERWLGDPGFENDRLDTLEPFSVGPRNCVGRNLAWHEMRLLLATTILSFDLQLCEESRQWADQKVFSLWEKRELMCRLTVAKTD